MEPNSNAGSEMQSLTDVYRIACGMTSCSNLSLRHLATGQRFEHRMVSPSALVGSDPRCDVRLPRAIASDKELFFQVVFGRMFYLGLGDSEDESKRIKRRPVGSSAVEVNGFEIRAFEEKGRDTEIERSLDMAAEGRSGESEVYGKFELVKRNEGRENVVVPLDRPITLMGRSPRCRVCFNTWSASRFHAVCIAASDGVWIVDLKSRTGTFVKEVPIRIHCLKIGDRLRIGPTRFEYRPSSDQSRRNESTAPQAPTSASLVTSGEFQTLPLIDDREASADGDIFALVSALSNAVSRNPDSHGAAVDSRAIARTLNDMLRVQSLQLEEIRRLTAYLSSTSFSPKALLPGGGADGVGPPKATPQSIKPTGALTGRAPEIDVHEWFQQETEEAEERSVSRLLRKILGPR